MIMKSSLSVYNLIRNDFLGTERIQIFEIKDMEMEKKN